MTSTKTELAIIGAGPAGLSAALAAAQAGVSVTVLEEYPRPGGQYLRGVHHNQPLPPLTPAESLGRERLAQLTHPKITTHTGTLVWGLENHTLSLHGPDCPPKVEAKAIIIATGARERVLPFPGWTLPGVMTLGGAQILAKEHGLRPGKRVLIAGSGPLLLAVAAKLAQIPGTNVVGILEATRPGGWMAHAPALAGNTDRLREGWHYLQTFLKKKIPYRFGHGITQAGGEESLEGVKIARLNRQGEPLPGSEDYLEVDTLCLGFGFIPNTALTQVAGCELEYAPTRGGWVPKVNELFETSQHSIYAAGETSSLDGASAALVKGEIAGLAVARSLGYLTVQDFQEKFLPLKRRLRPLRRFGAMLNTLFTPPVGLNTLIKDDTILCRCEEVTAGEVRAAIQGGATTLSDLKNWTRVGQGPCQGRTCGALLAQQIAIETGQNPQDAGYFRSRPPVKPVPLESLA